MGYQQVPDRTLRVESLETRHLMAAISPCQKLDHVDDYDHEPHDDLPLSRARGNAYFFAPAAAALDDYSATRVVAAANTDDVAVTSLDGIPLLHTNPSASKKIYLDFT